MLALPREVPLLLASGLAFLAPLLALHAALLAAAHRVAITFRVRITATTGRTDFLTTQLTVAISVQGPQ